MLVLLHPVMEPDNEEWLRTSLHSNDIGVLHGVLACRIDSCERRNEATDDFQDGFEVIIEVFCNRKPGHRTAGLARPLLAQDIVQRLSLITPRPRV